MVKNFKCYECQRAFRKKKERTNHGITSGHQWKHISPPNLSKKGGLNREPKRFLFCPGCSVTFNSLESFGSVCGICRGLYRI